MGRRPAQDVDEGLLGVLPPVERAKQHRALDFGVDRMRPAPVGAPADPQADSSRDSCASRGAQPRLLPATVGQDSRVLFQSGHDVSTFRRLWLRSRSLSADSRPSRIGDFELAPPSRYCRIFPTGPETTRKQISASGFRTGDGGKTLFTKNLHG